VIGLFPTSLINISDISYPKFAIQAKGAATKELSNIKAQFGLGPKSDEAETSTDAIEWYDRNYPPYVKIMHYDPHIDQMPKDAYKITKMMHHLYRLSLFAYVANLFWTCVSSFGARPPIAILYSVILLGLGAVSSTFAFYVGYKGIAGDAKRLRTQYSIAQGILAFLFLLFGFINAGNIHGWTAIGTASTMGGLFDFICTVESITFLGLAALGAFVVYQTAKYDGHGSWKPDKKNRQN